MEEIYKEKFRTGFANGKCFKDFIEILNKDENVMLVYRELDYFNIVDIETAFTIGITTFGFGHRNDSTAKVALWKFYSIR